MFGLTPIKFRLAQAQAKAYMHITNDNKQPLFVNLNDTEGRQIKKEKSWMGQTGDIIGQVMSVQHIHKLILRVSRIGTVPTK